MFFKDLKNNAGLLVILVYIYDLPNSTSRLGSNLFVDDNKLLKNHRSLSYLSEIPNQEWSIIVELRPVVSSRPTRKA